MARFAFRGTVVQCSAALPTADHLPVLEHFEDALLVVEDGRVTHLAQGEEAAALEKQLGLSPTVLAPAEMLLPGFIDLHVHAPQVAIAGTGTGCGSLIAWLETRTYPAQLAMEDPAHAAAVYDAVVERLLRRGITTACYFASIHLEGTKRLVDACIQRGQRAWVGKVCTDRCSPPKHLESTDAAIRDTEALIEYAAEVDPSGLVRAAITPRFIPACSEELLQGLGGLARKHADKGVLVQSHIAQSLNQVAFTEKLHPGRRDVQLFDSAGLLTKRCILAHGVHLSHGELDLLARRGSSLAFCPLANAFHTELPAKTLDVRSALEDHRVRCGLATDVAGGYSSSMISTCRTAVLASRFVGESIDWRYALWLATRGGATALGLEAGGFEVGNFFDAQLIDTGVGDVFFRVASPDGPDLATTACADERTERFINLGDDRNLKALWVRGREVFRQKEHGGCEERGG